MKQTVHYVLETWHFQSEGLQEASQDQSIFVPFQDKKAVLQTFFKSQNILVPSFLGW